MNNNESKVMETRLKKVAKDPRKALKKHEEQSEHIGKSVFGEDKQNNREGLEMTEMKGLSEKAVKHATPEMIGLTRSSS